MADLKNTTINDTGFFSIAQGTTAERPSSAVTGMMRVNTDRSDKPVVELYNGSKWQIIEGIVPFSLFGSGALSSTSISGTPNTYSHMTDSAVSAGSETMNVNSTSGMNIDDMAFIHQTQSYSPISAAGNYEIRRITGISGNTLTFESGLENAYESGRFNRTDQTGQVTQVVTSPAYSSVNLNGLVEAKEFDGFSGGIVFITASNSIICNGNFISAWGKGYRGGNQTGGGGQSSGYAGESIRGLFNNEDNPNDTGGGGGDGDANAGGDSGASGGHATPGGRGNDGSGADPQGGGTIGSQAVTQIYMGGGGGAGGDNDNHSFVTYADPDTGSDKTGTSTWNSDFNQYTSFDPPWGANRGSTSPDVGNGGGIVVVAAPSMADLQTTVRGVPSVGTGTSGAKSGNGAAGSVYVITEDNGLSISNMFVQSNVQNDLDGDFIGESGDGRVRIDIVNGTNYNGSPNLGSGGTLVVNTNTGN